MTVYKFAAVPLRASKVGFCTGCGKKLRRQTTFSQTLNPFNKLPDGTVKTARDILDELRAKAEVWKQEPVSCAACTQESAQ